MKQLIIFDLDGTLIDTIKDLNNGINYANKMNGYPFLSVDHTTKAIGNGIRKLVERSIPQGLNNPNYEKYYNDFVEFYSKHYLDFSKPYEGIKSVLASLKESNYKLAIATNKGNDIAQKLINKLFPNTFDFVQGYDETVERKPSNKIVEKILANLKINKENVLYIGDTNVDYQTAMNSQLDLLLVTYGYRTKKELDNEFPLINKVDNPTDILDYILKLN